MFLSFSQAFNLPSWLILSFCFSDQKQQHYGLRDIPVGVEAAENVYVARPLRDTASSHQAVSHSNSSRVVTVFAWTVSGPGFIPRSGQLSVVVIRTQRVRLCLTWAVTGSLGVIRELWLKWFCEAGGGLTSRSQVGANPIPIPTPLIWHY